MASTAHDRLKDLPTEILDLITSHLGRSDLIRFSSTARWCWEQAVPLIWREVELVDSVTSPYDKDSNSLVHDEHDDTAIIKKLLVLATNPRIAQCVQILNHSCHVPAPPVFEILPWTTFQGQTLSYDPRLIRLVRLAVDNLTNVHTLYIIHGHPRLVEALVRSLFDRNRKTAVPVRRLWLESCRLSEPLQRELSPHRHGLATSLDFRGLTSLRLRRLHMPVVTPVFDDRNNAFRIFHRTAPTMATAQTEWAVGGLAYTTEESEDLLKEELKEYYEDTNKMDDAIWEAISNTIELPVEVQRAAIPSHQQRAIWAYNAESTLEFEGVLNPEDRARYSDDLQAIFHDVRVSPAVCASDLLRQCSETLTCLTFDWLLMDISQGDQRQTWFLDLFRLRFPHLRAFQLRNFTTWDTALPSFLFLLERCHRDSCHRQVPVPEMNEHDCPDGWLPLEFLEAHPKLQCLAWPLDNFYSLEPRERPTDRVKAVVGRLAITLTDLRVDTFIATESEPPTDRFDTPRRDCRRLFIERFAPHMTNIRNIKISGGVPLDERREILRALRRCPIQRISVISASSSIGNTWGIHSIHLPGEADISDQEDIDAIWRLGFEPPAKPDVSFVPTYGWSGAAPVVTTIAGCFKDSLRELKLCGFTGAPVLLQPTPITTPMLNGLKYMHKLEVLIMSLWINTLFEGEHRDEEILSFWAASRDPATTALVVIDENDPEPGSWDERIRALEPSNLARTMVRFIGPYLSDQAKRNVVLVRGSFSVGTADLYELDVRLGKDAIGNDICLDFLGPREELDSERRKGKLNDRRWF